MDEEMIQDTLIEGQAITEGTFGFSISDGDGNAYAINLETGESTSLGTIRAQTISGPDLLPPLEDDQEIEGLATVPVGDVDGDGDIESTIFGVSEANNGPGIVVRDVQAPPEVIVGVTQGRIGTEAGAAYDPTTSTIFNVQSDEEADSLVTALYRIPAEPPTDENGDVIDGPLVEELVGTTEGIYVDGLAIDSEGNAFASDFRLTDSLYSVDLETGDLSLVGSFGLDFDVNEDSGLDFAPDGTLYGITEDANLYTIDTETGAATFVAEITDSVTGELVPADLEGFAIADAATLAPFARVESDDIGEIPQEVLDANGLNVIDTEGIDLSERRFSFNDGEGIFIAGDGSISDFFQIEANNNGDDGIDLDELLDRATVTIERASVRNNGDDGLDVFGIDNTVNVITSTLGGNAEEGFEIDGARNDVNVSSSVFQENDDDGFDIDRPGRFNNVFLNDSVFRNNGDDGIDTLGSDNTITLSNVTANGNGEEGFEVDGIDNDITITDNSLFISNVDDGFDIDFPGVRNTVDIVRSAARENGENGFEISGRLNTINFDDSESDINEGSGFTVNGDENTVTINDSFLFQNGVNGFFLDRTADDNTITITDADIFGNAQDGIGIRGDNNDFTLSDVELADNGAFGLNVRGDGNTFDLTDIEFFGNGSGAVTINGDNNILTIANSNITIDDIINTGINNTITFA